MSMPSALSVAVTVWDGYTARFTHPSYDPATANHMVAVRRLLRKLRSVGDAGDGDDHDGEPGV
jgi:hypothetical protein